MAKKTTKKKRKTYKPPVIHDIVPDSDEVYGRGRTKYRSEGDFSNGVNRYFESLRRADAPSKSGLCIFLDISRETLNQYRKKHYPDIVAVAEERIKMWWINRLSKSSPIGAIFFLKNFDHKEFKDRVSGDPDNPVTLQITGMKIMKEK